MSAPKRVRGVMVSDSARDGLERSLSRSSAAVFGERGELLGICLDLKKKGRAITPDLFTDSLLTQAANQTATDDG